MRGSLQEVTDGRGVPAQRILVVASPDRATALTEGLLPSEGKPPVVPFDVVGDHAPTAGAAPDATVRRPLKYTGEIKLGVLPFSRPGRGHRRRSRDAPRLPRHAVCKSRLKKLE